MIEFRILVCGGRYYGDRYKVCSVLDSATKAVGDVIIIHGAATGADTLAAEWAKDRGFEAEAYPADWAKYKKSAGFVRNTLMLKQGRPKLVIAFPGGIGTKMMIGLAEKANVPTRIYT
jgi:hypothetical protein